MTLQLLFLKYFSNNNKFISNYIIEEFSQVLSEILKKDIMNLKIS